MEFANWIGKCYSTYTGKTPAILIKPKVLTPTPVFMKPMPMAPIKFTQGKVYGLSDFILNEQIKKAKRKTLIELLEDEKAQVNKQFKWEDVVGIGIVGLGLWALYTYSGYKVSFTPGQFSRQLN